MASVDAPAFSIIVVTWNCAEWAMRCLRSIRDHAGVPVEVLVVDNASTDGAAERIRREYPEAHLEVLSENVGFARANNRALERAQSRLILLLNPDTELRPGALADLATFLEAHPRAGLCGPTLWNPDGSRQPSILRYPTLGREFLLQTMLHRVVGRARREAPGTRRVEALTGAALCIRRECLDAIGPLDPALFMFYEDVDWCRRAEAAGWETWFVESAGILHGKAGSSAGEARTRTLVESLRSTVYYFRKHRTPGGVAGLRAVAAFGALVRSLRSGALWMAGRDRADQSARLAAYRRIFAWAATGRGL